MASPLISDFTQRLRSIGRESVAERVPEKDPPTKEDEASAGAEPTIAEQAVAMDKATGSPYQKVTQGSMGFIEGAASRFDKTRVPGYQEQLEIDKAVLPPGQFAMKYGKEAEDARFYESDDETSNPMVRAIAKEDNRPGLQVARDSTIGASAAFVGLTSDLTSGLIRMAPRVSLPGQMAMDHYIAANPDAEIPKVGNLVADVILEKGNEFADFIRKGKTQEVREGYAEEARTSRARIADSEAEYEASDKTLRDDFRRIGREAVISADSYLDNSIAAGDVVTEALGSIIPSLGVAGGVRAIVSGTLAKAGVKGVAKGTIETITTAATVGIMEGQGAYSQTRREILQMSEEDLMAGSEKYRALREKGDSHELAKDQVAEAAAVEAQVMTSIVAAGISLPVAGFEGGALSRLGRRSLVQAVGDIASQTVEESAQNATSQYFQNMGIKDYADETRAPSEGVGRAVTEGAIGGFGATTILSAPNAPGIVLQKQVQMVKGVGSVGKMIGGAIATKRARKAANAKVDEFAIEVEKRFNEASDIIAAIEEMDGGAETTQETRAALERARTVVEPLIEAFKDTESDDYKKRTKTFQDQVVPGSKLKTLVNVARKLSTDNGFKEDSKEAVAASEFLMDEMARINGVLMAMEVQADKTPAAGASLEEVAQAQEAAAVDNVAAAKTRAAEFTGNMTETPVFSKSLQDASQVLNAASAKSVQEGTGVIPIKSYAEVVMNPVGIDPARITEEVRAGMPEEIQKAVAVVEAIRSPEHKTKLRPVKGNRTNTREGSRQETLFQSKSTQWGEIASFNDMVSQLLRGAIRHHREGNSVVRDTQGNEIDSVDVLEDLAALVKHQQNKFNAATESYEYSKANPEELNTTRTFDSLGQKKGDFRKGKGKIYVRASSPNSMQTYLAIGEELGTGIRAYNALIEQFPELYKGEKLTEVFLPTVPEGAENAPASSEAAPQPAEIKSKQTEPTQVVADPMVDTGAGRAGNSVRSDKMSFKDLFQGGTETTLADTIQYLLTLDTIDAQQQVILSMIIGSGFARANPNTIVRQATAEERKAAGPNKTHGWWDPQTGEVVLFVERTSKLLHELIHAVTLEALFQNLAQASIKRAAGIALNPVEKAAVDLNDSAVEFMEEKAMNPDVAQVQAVMRDLYESGKTVAEKDRGMGRAISEFMAYGLTETKVEAQLSEKKYRNPSMAKGVISLVSGIFRAVLGVRQPNKDYDYTAFDKLFMDTKTLALDTQSTVLQPREVKRTGAKNVEKRPQTKDAITSPKGASPSTADAKEQAEAEPAGVRTTPPVNQEPAQAEVSSAPAEETDTTSPATEEFALINKITEVLAKGFEQVAQAQRPAAPVSAPVLAETAPETKAIIEDAIESLAILDRDEEQLIIGMETLYDSEGVSAAITFEEFRAVARELSAKDAKAKKGIRNLKSYQNAIRKLTAYEKQNGIGNGIGFAEVWPEALGYMSKMRDLLELRAVALVSFMSAQHAEAQATLGTLSPTAASPAVATSPSPAAATADAVGPTAAKSAPTSVSAAAAKAAPEETKTQPAKPAEVVEGEVAGEEVDINLPADWQPTYIPGSNLLGNKEGSLLSKLVTKMNPQLQPGDTLDRLISAVAPTLQYKVTPEMKQVNDRVRKEAFRIMQGMQERVGYQVTHLTGKKGKPTLGELQAFQRGESDFNPARSEQFRVLAWLDAQSVLDGKPKYDDHILMLALMATADYVMNNADSKGVSSIQDAMKMLGLSDMSKLSQEQIKDILTTVNAGRPGVFVKAALAAHIQEFLGAELNQDMSPSETNGVFEALSHEILDYLSFDSQKVTQKKDFWIKAHTVSVSGRTVTSFSFGKPAGWHDTKTGKLLLRDVLTSRSSDIHRYSIGVPWTHEDVARSLKKNHSLKIPAKQRKALKTQQSTPFYFSKEFFEMYQALGPKVIGYALGYKDIQDNVFYNGIHEQSVVGKNTSISYGINNTRDQIDEIIQYAEKNNMDPHEVPVYYRISIGNNTRFNFEGFNPQQNKFAREMFSPTRHTISLQNQKQENMMYAAIAQSLGEDVGNLGIEVAAARAKELLETTYANIVDAFANQDLKNKTVRRAVLDELIKIGLSEDEFTLRGLWTAVRLKKAKDAGETEFTTDMYMELDGRTNGPISTAIQLFMGQYSPEILATWRRGGYFLSNAFNENDGITYSQWKNGVNVDSSTLTPVAERSNADLYGRVGELMARTTMNLKLKIQNGEFFGGDFEDAAQQQAWVTLGGEALVALQRLMNNNKDHELVDTPDGPALKIKRGATKSPIFQNINGAGAPSISSNLAQDYMNEFYALLSLVGQGNKEALVEAREQAKLFDELLQYIVVFDENGNIPLSITKSEPEGRSLVSLLGNANPSLQLIRDFAFSGNQAVRLVYSIRAFYITTFEEALHTAMDPSIARVNNDLIQGSQTHAKIYKKFVNKALREKYKELVASGAILNTHELPPNVRREVLDGLKDLAPIIDTGFSIYNLVDSDGETSTDVSRRIFGQKEAKKKGKDVEVEPEFNSRSRALSRKLIDSRRAVIGEAGVRILPFNVQTNSDVRMEIETWTHPDYPTNALAIHDGNNQATTDLEAASRVMNEAISRAWSTNTLRPILEAYDRALKFDDKSSAFKTLRDIRERLQIDVLRRDARIKVEQRIFTSYQGVPGADIAFVREGLRFPVENEMINYLNEEVDNEFNALIKSMPATAIMKSVSEVEGQDIYPLNPDKEFVKALGGKIRFKGNEVRQLMITATQFTESAEQFSVMTAVMDSVAFNTAIDNGLEIVIDSKATKQQNAHGFYNSYTNQLVLSIESLNPELFLHEAIHAATMNTIWKMSMNVDFALANPAIQKELQTIEGAMKYFMGRRWEEGSSPGLIQQALQYYLDKADDAPTPELGKVQALSEFIAYALSQNRTLIESRNESKTSGVKFKEEKKDHIVLAESAYSENALIAILQRVVRSVMRIFNPQYRMQYRTETYSSYKLVLVKNLDSWGDKLIISTRNLMKVPHDGSFRTTIDSMMEVSKQHPELVDPEIVQRLRDENMIYYSTSSFSENKHKATERKIKLQQKVGNQVSEYLVARLRGDTAQATQTKRAQHAAAYAKAKNGAMDALNTMKAAGFTIEGPQDILLFQTLHSVVAADMKMDKVALQELQQVYAAVLEKLGTDTFEEFGAQGVTGQLQSQRMYAAVLGESFFDVTGAREFLPPRGPASIERLAAFIALAQVSPEMRQVLDKIGIDSLNLSTGIETKGGVDDFLGSIGTKAVNRVTGRVLGETRGKDATTSSTLDVLTDLLLEYNEQAASSTEQGLTNALRGMNVLVKGGIESAAAHIADGLSDSASKATSEASQLAQEIGAGLSNLLVGDRAKVQLDALTSFLNNEKVPEALRNIWAEMRSINEDTVGVLRLVKKAKDIISRMRQEYIDKVPQIIRNSFGESFDALSEKERRAVMSTLFFSLGKTDFGILDKVIGSRSAIKFFGTNKEARSALNDQIKEMRTSIARDVERFGLPKTIEQAYLKKAEQLGTYMVTKKAGFNLLTSAVGILNLHNEAGNGIITDADYKLLQDTLLKHRGGQKRINDRTRRLIDTIDALASLEAISKLDDTTHDKMAEFLKTQRKAVLAAIDYQRELHRLERAKVDINSAAALNGLKGHFTTNNEHKHSVIVAEDSMEQTLREQGYTKIRVFQGPAEFFDSKKPKRSYYFSAYNSLATYNQGAMQTVQDTYFGVDPVTGFAIGSETSGNRVTGKEMDLLNRRMKAQRATLQTTEDLIPRFDTKGRLIAFEEAVSADMFSMLKQTNDYADSLGRWAGRLQEEKASHGLNYELLDSLKRMYDEDVKQGRGGEYASFGREQKSDGSWGITDDLANDPVWEETYYLMPRDAREYAEELFGGPIMIRRDMINNALGFRSMSVGDLFTGKSRLNEEFRENLKEFFLAISFLGPDMYKYLTSSEELLQEVVSGVKHIIVVKSGIFMVMNAVANFVQLASNNVPVSYMTQRVRSKWAELERYKENEALKIELRYKYLASKSNAERSNLQARMNSIDEANKKMTIWPMIEAHQFTSISEGLTDNDRVMFNKGFGDWIEKKAAELPGPMSTVARYALVAKDTALYQGLAKGVQYSDFIAKSVLYDFLTEEEGMAPEAAILRIDQEFINYDLNSSRAREYGESMGLWWFANFKIRSVKVAINLLKNNPVSALLALSGASVLGMDVGSPVTDNLAAATADGRIWYSIGPGMIDAGWNLNFWNQLFGGSS